MANNDHTKDNQGNGGTSGRFEDGANKPGGKKQAGAANEFADHIHGTDGDNTIDGLGGNDVLLGHQGNDTIAGNAGDDNIGGGAGDDFLSGDGTIVEVYDDVTEEFLRYDFDYTDAVQGSDTFSHSGDVEKDGTDTIDDFDCATEVEGEWNVVDVIELDVSTFGEAGFGDSVEGSEGTGVFADGSPYDDVIEAGTLIEYLYVDGGNLVADLDGTDTVDAGNPIVLTDCADGVGVAVEINDQTFVWDGAGWTDDIL